MTQAVTIRTTLDVDDMAAAKRTAQLLKHKGGLFPQDLTEGQAAVIARLSLLLGLDPMMDELIVYQGKPYLTLKGAMRLANEHPAYDGIECLPATPEEREAFRARDDEQLWVARVWRKDRRVPNVGYGRASAGENDQPVARKWTAEMAQKRAKHRALRDAFSLPVPGLEEAGDPVNDERAPVIEGQARELPGDEPEGPEPIRNDQIAAIHAIASAIGWISKDDDTAYRDALLATFHVVTSKDLSANQASAFIEVLVAEQEDMIVGDRDARSPTESPHLRSLIGRMDEREAPDWPTPAPPSQLSRLRARAVEIGMTSPQLAGLIATQFGEGVGLEALDARQAAALLRLLATGGLASEAPTQELPL